MSRRSYNQICGLAQALDLIGERWTLLVLRELLLGPKRFGALKDALPGVSANLLSERLRSLADAGLIESIELPSPATGISAYALTERGEGLREPIESLSLWGMDLLEPEKQIAAGWTARGSLMASSLMAQARRDGSLEDLDSLVLNASVAGERFVIRVIDGAGSVRHGAIEDADAELDLDLRGFYEVLSGRMELDSAAVVPAGAVTRVAALLTALGAGAPATAVASR